MADCCSGDVSATNGGKRVQFGTRFLNDPARVFHHNAWDNVEWSEEQEAAAERRVRENSAQRVPSEKQVENECDLTYLTNTLSFEQHTFENTFSLCACLDYEVGDHSTVEYEVNAHEYWNNFYKIHENGFFKDRHWLFTEFPELIPRQNQSNLLKDCDHEITEHKDYGDGLELIVSNTQEQHKASSQGLDHKEQKHPTDEATQKLCHLDINSDGFPGSSATYRILEVGCGVGNTVFPILHTNNDPGLFVYCCDFSTTAVDLVQTNSEYDPSRCFAFVHDLCDEDKSYPMPRESLDIIILIFVLSSIVPDKMQNAINRLSYLLKPGGMILLRDYGRYDMAQLRFKTGRCLSENFYVRGDGTRVYFFTQDELDTLFTTAGLEKVQNIVDHRLQVNRGKQLTMYRVWIQCKYRKPFSSNTS